MSPEATALKFPRCAIAEAGPQCTAEHRGWQTCHATFAA